MLKNVYEGWNAQKCVGRHQCSKMCMKASMLKNVYGGIDAEKCVWRLKCSFQTVFIQSVILWNVPDLRVFWALRVYFVFWGTLRPAVLAPRSVWSGYGWDQLPPSSFGHEMYRFPAILWTRFLHLIERHSGEKEKNDRPGDDGTLRSV